MTWGTRRHSYTLQSMLGPKVRWLIRPFGFTPTNHLDRVGLNWGEDLSSLNRVLGSPKGHINHGFHICNIHLESTRHL